MTNKLLIIDGHSVAFRAFYALPPEAMTTAQGQSTTAVYGFINMLVRMLNEENPDHLAVAFDLSRHSFRTEEYPEYKGTRSETPPEFKGQIPLIQKVLDNMRIKVITKENFEADDILATLATQATSQGFEVLVASGDRDAFQLVNEKVTVLWPGQSPSDVRHMTPQAVKDKYDVYPERYPELAALVGETSDNLPGVPGVGPKTAAQWLNKYDGLENLIARAEEIGGKRGVAFREHLQDVKRNRRLNRLVTDLDLGVELSDLRRQPFNRTGLEEVFDSLQIHNLRKRVFATEGQIFSAQGGDMAPTAQEEDESPQLDLDGIECVSLSDPGVSLPQWLKNGGADGLVVYPLGNPQPASPDCHTLVLATRGRALVIDLTQLSVEQDKTLRNVLHLRDDLVFYSYKSALHMLQSVGYELNVPSFDIVLAAYLVDPDARDYELQNLLTRFLHQDIDLAEESDTLDLDDQSHQIALTAALCIPLQDALAVQLEEKAAEPLMREMELPLTSILYGMEHRGIAVSENELQSIAKDLDHMVLSAQDAAYEAIGESKVNLSSPKQLQEILFERLNMPKTRKTKTGYTTNAEALKELYAKTQHPFLGALLEHRDKIKLRQTVEGLLRSVGDDGRIHTTFQQTVAATGRLSSTDPNMQNIPARSAAGLRIREAFIPGDDFLELMTVDYSQIEMRIMAHLSGDEGLIEAFSSGEDIHSSMAAIVFGVDAEEVSASQRSKIKAMSYGLVYGLSAFGLSKQLGIAVSEAKTLMDIYFSRFGKVKAYLDQVVEQARVDGFTQTLLGRRRYLPNLLSSRRQLREIAQRAALNAPIQGSAADLIKLAMLEVDQELVQQDLKSRVLLQVHDELVLEIAEGERATVEELVRTAMGSAMELSVPLEVSVGVGQNWREAAH